MSTKRFILAAIIVCSSVAYEAPAIAQTLIEATIPVSEAQRQVLAAVAAAEATREAMDRQNDRALRRKLFELEDLRAEIFELKAEGSSASAEIEDLRNALAVQQAQFVEDLETRDRVYAEEIATYRQAVEDIAATPEGLAALERFNAGEEAEALAILDSLRAVRDLAAARRISQLALDAWRRSKVSTLSVIERYEEITVLDPDVFGDWIELTRLRVIAGDLEAGLLSARAAQSVATNDREQSVAFEDIGNIGFRQGDLDAALSAYTRGLETRERLALADPSNAQAQRDVSVSLTKVGDVRAAQGDLDAALSAYTHGLEIAERLALADPSNAETQRDVSVSLNKVGDVRRAQGDLDAALSAYTHGLEIRERLALADPSNAQAQRDVIVSLFKISSASSAQDNLAEARAYLQRALVRNADLIAKFPNPQWQNDRIIIQNALEAIQ
ncbi:MAG: tetratricopeptide repeat protein [Hyphomicrobiales bacterium]